MGTFRSREITFGDMHPRFYPSNTANPSRGMLRIFACLAILIASCTIARAQTSTGQFTGHVFDQNGAVVASHRSVAGCANQPDSNHQDQRRGLIHIPSHSAGNIQPDRDPDRL